jgi:hypothetical protein
VARLRLTLGYRLRRLRRVLAARFTRPPKPPRDLEAEQIAQIEALVRRLEVVAGLGGITAAGMLAAMASDEVGQARRRLAGEALQRLRSRVPAEGVEAGLR